MLAIVALIGAGSDTTLVAQQWAVYSLLKNDRDQIPKALASADAFSNALGASLVVVAITAFWLNAIRQCCRYLFRETI